MSLAPVTVARLHFGFCTRIPADSSLTKAAAAARALPSPLAEQQSSEHGDGAHLAEVGATPVRHIDEIAKALGL